MDSYLAVFKGKRELILQGVSASPVLANDELQSGPDGVDSGHFDIDQIERKGLAANNIFSDISRNFRRLLWPGHPDHAVGLERLLQPDEVGSEFGVASREGMDRVEGFGGKSCIPMVRAYDFGERRAIGEPRMLRRKRDEGRVHARLEAKLFGERFVGIARAKCRDCHCFNTPALSARCKRLRWRAYRCAPAGNRGGRRAFRNPPKTACASSNSRHLAWENPRAHAPRGSLRAPVPPQRSPWPAK